MDLNEYQRLAMRTNGTPAGSDDCMYNAILGLCGEAGELADYIKKFRFHGHPLDPGVVLKELGDILWYTAQMAEAFNFPLSIVGETNIDKLRRRYPGKFNTADSLERRDTK